MLPSLSHVVADSMYKKQGEVTVFDLKVIGFAVIRPFSRVIPSIVEVPLRLSRSTPIHLNP